MKELYISPEVEVTCFAPVEGIASNWDQYAVNSVNNDPNSPVFNGDAADPTNNGQLAP